MRIAFYILFTPLLIYSTTLAQWSTSTLADSTLYVCPGFYPGIVTFQDGSSIVLGALDSYIFARKLDEYGYYQWPEIQVFHSDSSFITQTRAIGDWGGWISDGDGGVILFWYDHRGAYDTGTDWANNAIYVQRVDRFGVVRWTPGGMLLNAPQTGLKRGDIVMDGEGGFYMAWTEIGFGYPGSPGRHYLKAAHYSQDATRFWETVIDSSTNPSDLYSLNYLLRGGERLYMSYFASYVGNSNFHRIIDIAGNVITRSRIRIWRSIRSERDSVTYFNNDFSENQVFKLGALGDTIWIGSFDTSGTCQNIGGFIPDGWGGTYFLNACSDSIVHFDAQGLSLRRNFEGIGFGARSFSDGNHGIVLANDTTAKRFNEFGEMIWPSSVMYLQDPGNAYFPVCMPDNNGGIISVFWTTRGGIYGQHTGRNGQLGIVTFISTQGFTPVKYSLEQNYPNPFNPTTTIRYLLPNSAQVRLEIVDILGRTILNPINEFQLAGTHQTVVDASAWPTGVYFYRLKVNSNIVSARKMLLVK